MRTSLRGLAYLWGRVWAGFGQKNVAHNSRRWTQFLPCECYETEWGWEAHGRPARYMLSAPDAQVWWGVLDTEREREIGRETVSPTWLLRHHHPCVGVRLPTLADHSYAEKGEQRERERERERELEGDGRGEERRGGKKFKRGLIAVRLH